MRVLVLRLSSIGDLICITPVLRALYLQKEAEIHLVVKQQFAELFQYNPYVKRVIGFGGRLMPLIRVLRQGSWDCVLDLHNVLRTRLITLALRVGGRVRCVLRTNKRSLRRRFYAMLHRRFPPIPHIVSRHFEAVRPLGVEWDGGGLDLFIPAEAFRVCDRLPRAYVVVAPWGTHPCKSLPFSTVVGLVRQLLRITDVVLTGGRRERRFAQKICSEVDGGGRGRGRLWNLVGVTSLLELGAVVARATHVYTVDTSVMHMACALSKPLTVFWGCTVPDLGMPPFVDWQAQKAMVWGEGKIRSVFRNLPCQPCHTHGARVCPYQDLACLRFSEEEMQPFVRGMHLKLQEAVQQLGNCRGGGEARV